MDAPKNPPWWGRGKNGTGPYHFARAGDGTPSLCGKVKKVVVADHVVVGATCVYCRDQLRPRTPAAGSLHLGTARALAEFVRRMMPFARMLNVEVAGLVALFCASHFKRHHDHPRHQEFVDAVYAAALAQLGGLDGEPRLTKVERLWRIEQGVKRRAPRVDCTTWADRWRRVREERAQREHAAMLRVRCAHCGAMPDDCECSGPGDEGEETR